MFENGAAKGRRDDNAEPVRDFGQDMAGALGDFGGGFRSTHFALDPVAVADGQLGLRGDFLCKETVCGCGRYTARRGVRLIE